jgi:ribosomal protein S18 acetylase RimI-like enzyme
VLETLLATPGLVRVETQLPHFSFESLDPVFREHSFEGYLRRFMVMSLPRPRWTPYGSGPSGAGKSSLRDFRIVPWERRHDSGVAQVILSAYRNHVDARINDQYASVGGTTRLVESILQQRGCGELQPTASLVAVHTPTGQLAAALAVTAVRARTAHIPQIAVASEFQNHGLGSALLETAFLDLTKNRFEEVSLTVTDVNAGAVRLYQSLDFLTFRSFGAFTWGNIPQV